MPDIARELFERGKERCLQDNYADAVRDFVETIRRDPDNADYQAWLGAALGALGDWAKAREALAAALRLNDRCAAAYVLRGFIDEGHGAHDLDAQVSDYSRAIELDPGLEWAYRCRGRVLLQRGDFERAIADCSEAIALNGRRADAYGCRSQAYFNAGQLRAGIADLVRYFSLTTVLSAYLTDDEEWKPLGEALLKHMRETLVPEIAGNGQRLVGYWPCHLLWAMRQSVVGSGNRGGGRLQGSKGVGYICLTDRGVHIVSLGTPSKQYVCATPPWLRIIGKLISASDLSSVEKEDKKWEVPYLTIAGQQGAETVLTLATADALWQLDLYWEAYLTQVLAATDMGNSGELASIVTPTRR